MQRPDRGTSRQESEEMTTRQGEKLTRRERGEGDMDEEEEAVCFEEWLRKEGKQFVRRFVRSFSKAAAVYAGVGTFTAFFKNPFRKGRPAVWRTVVSKDCLQFAAFLGLYPSVYHLTVSILRRYRKHKDGWNYGIAGGIAGLSLALEAHSRRKTLAFFVAARALGAGATTLVARDLDMQTTSYDRTCRPRVPTGHVDHELRQDSGPRVTTEHLDHELRQHM
ncbi:hypothetical protein BaRGS_00005629 [Batillaria attramentaria]|uniref:Uncharacterized protein n=1 Tax=Batillaria attramentaria TaxID=370345 RepID=A0ABD0LUD3_9CAEN